MRVIAHNPVVRENGYAARSTPGPLGRTAVGRLARLVLCPRQEVFPFSLVEPEDGNNDEAHEL